MTQTEHHLADAMNEQPEHPLFSAAAKEQVGITDTQSAIRNIIVAQDAVETKYYATQSDRDRIELGDILVRLDEARAMLVQHERGRQ